MPVARATPLRIRKRQDQETATIECCNKPKLLMSDQTSSSGPDASSTAPNSKTKSFRKRLAALLLRAPDDREQLTQLLRESHLKGVLDDDAMSMIEGVLQVARLAVRDIMVPRSQMDVIDISQPAAEFMPVVISTAHSRFPVVDGERDNVIGILHAKELLRLYEDNSIDVRDLLRPAVFIPESKRLNVLLREFRVDRYHLAIVVDEYGGVAGLITIEDVLEQIVGDIEDEFDFEEVADNIVQVEPDEHGARFRIRAVTEISQFNQAFAAALSESDFDTLGGLITDQLGRVPHRGETVELGGFRFNILRADARQVQLVIAQRLPEVTDSEGELSVSG
jgi:magnesium and cobalt transporter